MRVCVWLCIVVCCADGGLLQGSCSVPFQFAQLESLVNPFWLLGTCSFAVGIECNRGILALDTMAFEPASRTYHCFKCRGEFNWFQLLESGDPATHEHEDMGPLTEKETQEGASRTRRKVHRVCTECEVKWREKVQDEHPIGKEDRAWATLAIVQRDLKRANKGQQKITRGIHYQAAVCIVEEDPEYQKLTKKAKAKAKTKKCKTLADAFAKAIQNGQLFSAFRNAGNRLQLGEALYDEANSLYDEYLADPESKAKLEALEDVELEIAKRLDYTTAGGDTKVLKELDHHNDLDQDFGIYLFDVCRRGGELQCGVYMPSDFWWQDGEMLSFKCKICPEKIKLKQPKMYQTIKEALGDTPEEKWSICTPCCGSKFIPWARGASKVMELKVGNAIHAILADRLPVELDDEIKNVQYEWHLACGRT